MPRISSITKLGIVSGENDADQENAREVDLLLRSDNVIHDDDSPMKTEIVGRAFRGEVYL